MPDLLTGSQQATKMLLPTGLVDDTAVTLARAAGMPLDPWQAEILRESGRRRDDGTWSAFEVAAIVPRQNGKSYLIAARALAGALLYDDALTLYSAHEMRTAREVWHLVVGLCQEDYLSPLVSRIYSNAQNQEIVFTNGCRFRVVARTRNAGRGFSADCVLFDEALYLTDDMLSAVLPTLSARPNPQLWYVSSAGTWESHVLAGIRARGHAVSSTDLAYWEWCATNDDDPNDPTVWAAANPAYGTRLRERAVRIELNRMSRKAFQRERLGVWQQSATEPVLKESDVEHILIDLPRPPQDGRYVAWGVDVAKDRSGAAIAAAFRNNEGVPVVTLVETRPGAHWLGDRLAELDVIYGVESVCYDARGNLVDLMERAERDHDVRSAPLRQPQYVAACAGFVQMVSEHSIYIGRAPALVLDCNSASARGFVGGWVWDRGAVTPPTAIIAATNALYQLMHEDGDGVGVY